MSEDDYSKELSTFLSSLGIQIFHFRLQGNKEPFIEMDHDQLRLALGLVLDPANHPILVHCNKGKVLMCFDCYLASRWLFSWMSQEISKMVFGFNI